MTAETLRRTPQRIQRQRTKGWRMPEGAVYVGRGSRYGNPFKVERVPNWPRWGGSAPWRIVTPDGRTWHPEGDRKPVVGRSAADAHRQRQAVEGAVELFALHAGPMGNYEIEDEHIEALAGLDLACWCPLDQPCHADVLLDWANRSFRPESGDR
mgnify:CR=1 FL=1